MAKYRVLDTMYGGNPGYERLWYAGDIIDSSEITGNVRPGVDQHLELIEGDEKEIAAENKARLLKEARALGIDFVNEKSTSDQLEGAIIHAKTNSLSDFFVSPAQPSIVYPPGSAGDEALRKRVAKAAEARAAEQEG